MPTRHEPSILALSLTTVAFVKLFMVVLFHMFHMCGPQKLTKSTLVTVGFGPLSPRGGEARFGMLLRANNHGVELNIRAPMVCGHVTNFPQWDNHRHSKRIIHQVIGKNRN